MNTDDDVATDLFAEALRAVEHMVVNAAQKSIPKSKFLPNIKLEPWDRNELRVCAELFVEAVRVTAETGAHHVR